MDNLPILNWVSHHDERSRDFPIRGAIREFALRDKMWRIGPILDQGREGACVGFGWTAEALSTPVAVKLDRVVSYAVPVEGNEFARFLYHTAQTLDEWAGENYEGTSVLAGAKAMQKVGLLKSYRWAFSIDDVIQAILGRGPVVLGIEWRSGMYEAPGGVLTAQGQVVGGHCITAVGYKTSSPLLDGDAGIVLQNSWGEDWGNKGTALIRVNELADLLSRNGEACVPYGRSYGRRSPAVPKIV